MWECVDDHTNESLCVPFREKETSGALFHIVSLKAPGMDGFPAHFLHRNKDLPCYAIVRAVQGFFADRIMLDLT
jgi:hypothetical protein